jgi:hypothetical protein
MKQSVSSTAVPSIASTATIETLEARFALQVTARLTEQSMNLGADIDTRLRFAREKALSQARLVAAQTRTPVAAVVNARGAAALLGGGPSSWWLKFASIAPAFALAAGLFLIQNWHIGMQISAAAEVDAALLADDLPPTAYKDPGFAEFLKMPSE